MKQATTPYRTKIYLGLTGFATFILCVASLITGWAAYPTAAHREIGHEMNRLTTEAWKSGQPDGVYSSEAFTALTKTPEFSYISIAEPVGTWLQFLVLAIVVGFTYNYLRRRKLSPTRRDLGITTLIVTAASTLSYLIAFYPRALITGGQSTFDSGLMLGLGISTIVTAIIVFLLGFAFEKYYNKRHSFLFE